MFLKAFLRRLVQSQDCLVKVTCTNDTNDSVLTCFLSAGTSPGLYTEDELQSIVSQMMPGGVQTKKIDKIEQAFDRFLRRVKQHLHVVVCLSYRGKFV